MGLLYGKMVWPRSSPPRRRRGPATEIVLRRVPAGSSLPFVSFDRLNDAKSRSWLMFTVNRNGGCARLA